MVIYRYRYLKGVLEQNERSEADKTIYEWKWIKYGKSNERLYSLFI